MVVVSSARKERGRSEGRREALTGAGATFKDVTKCRRCRDEVKLFWEHHTQTQTQTCALHASDASCLPSDVDVASVLCRSPLTASSLRFVSRVLPGMPPKSFDDVVDFDSSRAPRGPRRMQITL